MAALSFRDRFFTPKVARAVTSPSGILAGGAGAAIGILATVGTAGLAAPIVAGLAGAALGWGGRVALAIPRNERSDIDTSQVQEPWRHAVRDAEAARTRFVEAVGRFRDGPMKASLSAISGRLDDAVDECWRIARQGQAITDARRRINDQGIDWEIQRTETKARMAGDTSATQQATLDSLRAQLATAARMDALIASSTDQLDLINARMDQAVTQAIELSVSGSGDAVAPLGLHVDAIVDDLESLRVAMDDLGPEPGDDAPARSTDPADR